MSEQKNNGTLTHLTLIAMVSLLPALAHALPGHRNLLQGKTGGRVSCTVCHSPTTGRLTTFGRDFRRLGSGTPALEALLVMDPDKDGISSTQEFKAGSNPGDLRSTPGHPGPWLTGDLATPLPIKELSLWFGATVQYTVVERRLTKTEIQDAELTVRQKLYEAETFPSVFVARSSGPAGGALLGAAGHAFFGNEALSTYLVAMDATGRVKGLKPLRLYGEQRLARPEYLRQYEGKKSSELLSVAPPMGAEGQNATLIGAVKRALAVMEAVMPRE